MNRNLRIKQSLDNKLQNFDYQNFIEHDPISVVYQMQSKPDASYQDVELCAILTAMISWGNREQIISHATALMEECNWKPHSWIVNMAFQNIPDNAIIYRTLNGKDFKQVCWKLCECYSLEESIMNIAQHYYESGNKNIDNVIDFMCSILKPAKMGTTKMSSCKRINMLLRWLIRSSKPDLGLWKFIDPSELYAIIDMGTIRQARTLGILDYKTPSWSAMLQLTDVFRNWDACDPLKYDMVLMDIDINKERLW